MYMLLSICELLNIRKL